jgi:hypothetical protein
MVLVLAPAVMLLLSLIERRFGPAAAGWLAAAPITLAIAVLGTGPEVAASAAAHVPAQVAFAVVLGRRNLLLAIGAYVVVSFIPYGVVLAVPALIVGMRALPEPATEPPEPAGVVLRAVVATLVVAAILTAARVSGPGLAGAIAAFPALSTVLALTSDPAHTLRGLLNGLAGYFAFAATVGFLVPSVPVGLAACAVMWVALSSEPRTRSWWRAA